MRDVGGSEKASERGREGGGGAAALLSVYQQRYGPSPYDGSKRLCVCVSQHGQGRLCKG